MHDGEEKRGLDSYFTKEQGKAEQKEEIIDNKHKENTEKGNELQVEANKITLDQPEEREDMDQRFNLEYSQSRDRILQEIKTSLIIDRDRVMPFIQNPSTPLLSKVLNENGDGSNPLVLLQVEYDGGRMKALCKLYDAKIHQVFHWYDDSNHLPYFYVDAPKERVQAIREISGSPDFVSVEEVEKFNALKTEYRTYSKVICTNPQAVPVFRRIIEEKNMSHYESHIRYHLNYIYDKQLWPGTWYQIDSEGKLERSQKIDTERELQNIVKGLENEVSQDFLGVLVEKYNHAFLDPVPDLTRVAFDIEVYTEEGIFPDARRASNPVISIVSVDNNGRKIMYLLERDVFNRDEIDTINSGGESSEFNGCVLRYHKEEREMLRDFFLDIFYYPVHVTFNGDSFDLTYLINRAKQLKIDTEEIPWKEKRNQEVACKHGVHLDLYRFFSQPSMRGYAFGGRYDSASLNELSTVFLGAEKIHNETFISDLGARDLLYYNLRDSELTLQLTQFNDNLVMSLIFMLMRITRLPIAEFNRNMVSFWIKNWFYAEHRDRNWIIPRKTEFPGAGSSATNPAIIEGKKFQGAIVIDPKPGIWWNVSVLDFASIYPSIIQKRNLSYETINCSHTSCKKVKIPETDYWVCQERIGIIAFLIGFVRDMRVYVFKKQASDPQMPNERKVWFDIVQSSLKVLINASYGVLGSENFAMYCLPLAEATTAAARDAMKSLTKESEKINLPVLYGDTDSIFVHNPSEDQVLRLIEFSEKELQMDLGTDYIFRYCVLSKLKKNYFGITEAGKVIVKGLSGKKKNVPPIIRNTFQETLNMFRDVHNEEEFKATKKLAIRNVRRLRRKFNDRAFDMEELVVSSTVSQPLKNYRAWNQVLQAVTYLHSKGKLPTDVVGFQISFVRVNQREFSASPDLEIGAKGSTITVLPVEFAKKEDIDVEKHLKMMKNVFMQVFEALDISWNDVLGIKTIQAFF